MAVSIDQATDEELTAAWTAVKRLARSGSDAERAAAPNHQRAIRDEVIRRSWPRVPSPRWAQMIGCELVDEYTKAAHAERASLRHQRSGGSTRRQRSTNRHPPPSDGRIE